MHFKNVFRFHGYNGAIQWQNGQSNFKEITLVTTGFVYLRALPDASASFGIQSLTFLTRIILAMSMLGCTCSVAVWTLISSENTTDSCAILRTLIRSEWPSHLSGIPSWKNTRSFRCTPLKKKERIVSFTESDIGTNGLTVFSIWNFFSRHLQNWNPESLALLQSFPVVTPVAVLGEQFCVLHQNLKKNRNSVHLKVNF